MSELVLLEINDAIATLTLNRPELRNPISDHDVVTALVDALRTVNDDLSISVAILTGAGDSFSSGGNLRTLGKPGELGGGTPIEAQRSYARGIQSIPRAFQELETPIIAAVNGYAVGAGCDLACMCDMRIAGASARFAESFVKLALIPGDGGAWLLPRIVGHAKACEMMFTGEMVSADEALSWGLVSKVVPDEQLMAAAISLARRIAANPAHTLRMAKRLLMQGRETRLNEHLEAAAAYQALAHATEDHREATAAFREKRPPIFKGK
jgi:enoyl-CoA hydratase/carnithine racemase